MSTTAMVVIVASLAFGLHWASRRVRSAGFLTSGIQFVVLGWAAGPHGLGLITLESIARLQPVVSLLLGLLGFHIGLSLRTKSASVRASLPAVLTNLLVGLTVTTAAWILIDVLGSAPADRAWLAVALGALGMTASRRVIDQTARRLDADGPVVELLGLFAGVSVLSAVVALGGALAFARADTTTLGLTPTEWLVTSMVVGAGCGVLHHVFLGRAANDDRGFVATIGVVVFSSGLAAGMGMSPLLVTAMAGLAVGALTPRDQRSEEQLERAEPLIERAVLVAAGAMWAPVALWVWILAACCVTIRAFALQVAPRLGLAVAADAPLVHGLGRGLLSQGALTVAIGINVAQVGPATGSIVLTIAFTSLLFTELVAVHVLRGFLGDSGAIDHTRALAERGPGSALVTPEESQP